MTFNMKSTSSALLIVFVLAVKAQDPDSRTYGYYSHAGHTHGHHGHGVPHHHHHPPKRPPSWSDPRQPSASWHPTDIRHITVTASGAATSAFFRARASPNERANGSVHGVSHRPTTCGPFD
ncbi:hypothetical protein MRX96_054386 [Rhipicephalus microplus]